MTYLKLIHDPKYFTEKSIKQRSERYGFPNHLTVELFLWNCEIAAQLQSHTDKLILKGGAATQLHLPVEKQRGSIDIDMITSLSEKKIEDILELTSSQISELSYKKYIPQTPTINIPLLTYFVNIPSLMSDRESNISIKTEFLLENLNLPHVTLPNPATFALETRNIKCSSLPCLIGDKYLTLARDTIGLVREEDVPKQIYDVATLSEIRELSTKDFIQIKDTISTLIPVETGYRNLQTGEEEIKKSIYSRLEDYCLLGTSYADKEIWKNIQAFQQFYVNYSQRMNQDEWSERAWRLRFLFSQVNSILEGELPQIAAKKYSKCMKIAAKMKKVRGSAILDMRKELLKHADFHIPYFKELRGKSLNRVYWQIIKMNNIESVHSTISPD